MMIAPHQQQLEHGSGHNGYLSIAIMIIASILVSYVILMTVLVPSVDITNNRNKLYGALLMGFVMGLIEALMMIGMTARGDRKRFGYWVVAFTLLVLSVMTYLMILFQVGVDQADFMKGMIEHHSMALTMSTRLQPKVRNPQLCTIVQEILSSQQVQIDEMKQLLALPPAQLEQGSSCGTHSGNQTG